MTAAKGIMGLLGFALAFVLVSAWLPERRVEQEPIAAPAKSPQPVPLPLAENLADIEFSQPALAPNPTASELPEAKAVRAAPAVLPHPAVPKFEEVTLYGVISNADGEPLPGSGVSVGQGKARRSGLTDEKGRYSLRLKPEGRELIAFSRNYHRQSAKLLWDGSSELLRRDFQLRRMHVVSVYLETSEGKPAIQALGEAGAHPLLLNLVPVAMATEPGQTFIGVRGSLNNTFGAGAFQGTMMGRITSKGPSHYGDVTLHGDGATWMAVVAAHQVIAKQPILPETRELRFTIDVADIDALRARLRARIVDAATGDPIRAKVWISFSSSGAGTTSAESDQDGLLDLVGILPGKVVLHVQADGFANHLEPLTIARGELVERGIIGMHRPVELSGKVFDSEGEPTSVGVYGGLLDEATGAVDWSRPILVLSDLDGTWRLIGVEPGIYLVRAGQQNGVMGRKPRSDLLRVDARQGSVSGGRLGLRERSQVKLVHPWTSANPHRVRILDGRGYESLSISLGRSRSDSPFVLHLVPGNYTLQISGDGEELERREIKVGEASLRVDLR